MKENSAAVEPQEPKPSPPAGSLGGKERSDQLGPGEWILIAIVLVFIALTFPVSIWLCLIIVNEYEEAVVLRLGHLQKEPKGPGTHFILPCTDKVISVDMRTKSVNVSIQDVLTKDPLQVQVETVIYFRVQNATLAVMSVADADSATLLLMETTVKKILETKYLFQIVTDREKIAKVAQVWMEQHKDTMKDTTANWGIMVEDVEIKDVITKMKVASEERGKTPPRVVKEASIVITESPMSLQFRCKQSETVETGQTSSTVVFRYP